MDPSILPLNIKLIVLILVALHSNQLMSFYYSIAIFLCCSWPLPYSNGSFCVLLTFLFVCIFIPIELYVVAPLRLVKLTMHNTTGFLLFCCCCFIVVFALPLLDCCNFYSPNHRFTFYILNNNKQKKIEFIFDSFILLRIWPE